VPFYIFGKSLKDTSPFSLKWVKETRTLKLLTVDLTHSSNMQQLVATAAGVASVMSGAL